MLLFFFQAEDGIRDADVTGVQTCALPISIVAGEREGHVGAREREQRHRLDRRAGLRGLRPQELAPGGRIEEQPAHGDRRPPLPRGGVHTLALAARDPQAGGDGAVRRGLELEPGPRCDRGQRFAAEPERRHADQVRGLSNFACGVTRQRELGVGAAHARAVVAHANQTLPTVLDFDADRAGAIRIEIEDGGKSLIRVSDDGAGMSRPDAELALSRHATSKIREAADLIGVATFGFRGEALPAIASGSGFELEPSSDGAVAPRLRVSGGKREGVDAAARQRGTTVTVRGLFFNTPARRKFLRAQATETRAAVEAVTLLALTRPDVAFTLTSDDRPLIDVRPTTRPIDRVHALWGQLADTLLPIAYREGPLEVRGFAQRPAQAKPAGRKGYVFVRGRPIRDPFILRAAEAGYRSTIAPGDRPSLVLFLELPGDAVDVNVHPSKLEVRFRDKFFVEKVVEEAVRAALGPLGAAAPLGAGDSGPGAWAAAGGSAVPLDMFAGDSRASSPEPRTPSLLQVFDSYIVFQTDSGVAIVDQHSAHERVLYERAMRQLTGDGASAQRLLLPLTLEFTAPELEAIDAHRELLRRVGYEVEPFSGRAVVVHTAPNPHPRFDAARCFGELVADL